MKLKFKKGLVFICFFAMLLVPLMSACGRKAPPKPPTEKSGEQTPNPVDKK
jgi:hypothetical protein